MRSAISEDRINVARTSFNELIDDYNTHVKVFPSNIISRMFKFKVMDYYINEENTNKAPKIDLS